MSDNFIDELTEPTVWTEKSLMELPFGVLRGLAAENGVTGRSRDELVSRTLEALQASEADDEADEEVEADDEADEEVEADDEADEEVEADDEADEEVKADDEEVETKSADLPVYTPVPPIPQNPRGAERYGRIAAQRRLINRYNRSR